MDIKRFPSIYLGGRKIIILSEVFIHSSVHLPRILERNVWVFQFDKQGVDSKSQYVHKELGKHSTLIKGAL